MKNNIITLGELEKYYRNLRYSNYKPKVFANMKIEVYPARKNSLLKSFTLNIEGKFNEYDTDSNTFYIFFEDEFKIDEYFKQFDKLKVHVYLIGQCYNFTLKRENSLITINRHTNIYFTESGVNSYIRLKLNF